MNGTMDSILITDYRLKDHRQFLINVSTYGDPSKAFYAIFPLLIGLHRPTGIGYLGSVILCEWLNLILKW